NSSTTGFDAAAEPPERYPILYTFPVCCAPAASGAARRPPVRVPRKARRVTTASAHRQREGESGPSAQLALDPDPAVMQLHELLRQGQPKPGAFQLPRIIGPHLAELLEDGRLVLGSDPDAGVGDGDFNCLVRSPGLHSDPSAFGGELDGVGEKVEENLLDLALIPDELPQARVQVELQGDAVARGALPDQGDGVLQGGRQVERGRDQFHAAGLDLGEVEDV